MGIKLKNIFASYYYIKVLIIISIPILFAPSAFCFSLAPPQGTPRIMLKPPAEIIFAYIDCFVHDSLAQVVSMSSLRFSSEKETTIISAEWSVDSAEIYIQMESGEVLNGKLSTGNPFIFYRKERNIALRISYEANIHRALSGPPAKWVFGRLFELNYPFIKENRSMLPINSFKARLIFPKDFPPENCADIFDVDTLREGLIIRQLNDPKKIEGGCRFKSVDR